MPCSGGGLAAGVALAVTERFPDARIYTAEPEGFDDYARSLAARIAPEEPRQAGSICDALLAPEPGPIGFEINRERLAGGLVASDEQALHAVGFAFDELRLVLEPGGAVGLAALLSGQLDVAGRNVVVLLSGGNIDDRTLADALSTYRSAKAA